MNFRQALPWLGWFIAATAGLYQFLLQTSTSVMITALGESFSLDSLGVSLLSSSYFYTYLICQIPAGMVIDYFQPRRTILIAQLCLAVTCLFFSNAASLWSAEAARIAMGIFAAPMIVSAFYLAARSLPEKYFSVVGGLTETMCMLGGAIGQMLLARGVTYWGWRYTMVVLAYVAVLLAICAWVFIRDDVRPRINPASEKPRSILKELYCLLTMPQAWMNGLFCGFLFGTLTAFGAFWGIPFLMQRYGIPLDKAADLNALIFIGSAIGSPLLGWLSTRIQQTRFIMQVCTIAELGLFLLIIYGSVSVTVMCFLIFALGFFAGVYLLPFTNMSKITPPHMHGAAMGFINMMCIVIGSPLLQPFVGWLLHAHTDMTIAAYQHAFSAIVVTLVIAFGLTFLIKD